MGSSGTDLESQMYTFECADGIVMVARGMVLVMSLWDDHAVRMLWLDSTYPVNGTQPGSALSSCSSVSRP